MSTEQPQLIEASPMLGLRDLTEILIKHYGHREGRFETAITFDIGIAPIVRPGTQSPTPTVLTSFVGLTLQKIPDGTESKNPDIVDAAKVNPA